MNTEKQTLAINTIRFLAVDMVQKANSGHPGLPMGAATMAYTIWTHHLRHNPQAPRWVDRDRFILSGGHGSAMLYALLHLTGYGLSLDDLKAFRQWGSLTPGHPEYGSTPGVETTTGPLGQGFSNGIGFAIAETHLAAEFNRPGHEIIDHFVYGIVTDGDLMEGVASEAASLAGHLRLGKLIYLYDDNHISIEGSTDIAFTEDRLARFAAYNWHIQSVQDGNDVAAIDAAINSAKADLRPSIIACRTHIGFGMPNRQDTSKAHGEPPGEEELRLAKLNMGWPLEPRFYVPEEVVEYFKTSMVYGQRSETEWKDKYNIYRSTFPELAAEFERRMDNRLPENWEKDLPSYPADPKGIATRAASGKTLNVLAVNIPELMGGSADLAPSTNTWLDDIPAFQSECRNGRNFHFGVREHGMGAIVNGMALHGGIRPYGATFLVFSDYMRGALRVGAFSHVPSIWVFTHDSIGVGEDGPTHQPVEQLATLRAIPNLNVIRPCDANETVEAWKMAISRRNGPTALILTRQALPILDRSSLAGAENLQYGAYVMADIGDREPELILMASGSEVHLIVEAGLRLGVEGVNVRMVSFPSWELFTMQSREYQDAVLPPLIRIRMAVEAGVAQGWERWVGNDGIIVSMEHYGASAPARTLFEKFGFTVDAVIGKARDLIAKTK